jgi:hypothetical protein
MRNPEDQESNLDKPIIPLKAIVAELLEGDKSLFDPLIPAVIEAWGRAVPESLRRGMTMEGIREGTLHLSVTNPVIGQQFQFLKESVREKMNTLLGEMVVQRIMVKAGPPLALPPPGKKGSRSRAKG